MKRLIIAGLAVLMVAGFAMAQNDGSRVDSGDVYDGDGTVSSGIQNQGSYEDQKQWDAAETQFNADLTPEQQIRYTQIKMLAAQIRDTIQAVRLKAVNTAMTSTERDALLAQKREEIKTQLNALDNDIDLQLTNAQRLARSERRIEIARKRRRMKNHLDAVRIRISNRMGGN